MKVLLISLGCDKNTVDSEVMLGYLNEKGYQLTDNEYDADIIIINTCTFIHDAKEESIQTILDMADYKKIGKCKVLIATGCLAQRYNQEILEEIPELDGIIGTTAYDEIVTTIETVLKGEKVTNIKDIHYLPQDSTKRVVTAGSYTSYLKIAEGCDKHCTYCIIPKIRGNYRSVPMEKLIQDANYLVQQGVKELIIIAQETTTYGVDLYGDKRLPELLNELCKIDGLQWIRLMYCYPEEITEELIVTMKEQDKICNYIDMPIQHSSNHILKKMGRRTTNLEIENIIKHLRREIPNIIIRTSLITGFPSETKEEHEELLDFVDKMEFDRLGVFTYSMEEDTPAASMPNQIEESIKAERREEIMSLQQDITFEKSENMVGNILEVLIEGKLVEEDIYIGRTYRDAPDVDGYIFVKSKEELYSGDFIKAKVTEAQEYDLIGENVYEFTK